VVTYNYYPDGSVSSVVTPFGQIFYGYDKAGELVSLSSPFAETTSFGYDHAGRPTSQSSQTGGVPIVTSYTYGVSGQTGDPSTAPSYLRTLQENVNGSLFALYTLTHSYLGQLQSQQATGDSQNFSYD